MVPEAPGDQVGDSKIKTGPTAEYARIDIITVGAAHRALLPMFTLATATADPTAVRAAGGLFDRQGHQEDDHQSEYCDPEPVSHSMPPMFKDVVSKNFTQN
jgi:hypothetical protein